MKLLILTQTVDSDDPTLGFFHTWIERFAEKCERVTVICLESGTYTLPGNVEVLSLGKERGTTKLGKIARFYWYIFRERNNYDRVFVHMNPEYVVMGGPLWRLWKKRVMLWYTHRSVTTTLRLAEKLAHIVASASMEGFRISSKKLKILGHGIDTESLKAQSPDFSRPLVITHVGRITRIKHIDVVIRAARELLDRGIAIARIDLVGGAVTQEDRGYKVVLEGLVNTLGLVDIVRWRGGMKSSDIPGVFAESSITVNAAPEGGMDKTVLESLAISRPAFVSNPAFRDVYDMYWSQFSYTEGSAHSLADRIETFLNLPESERRTALRTLADSVRVEYDIETLIGKIVAALR